MISRQEAEEAHKRLLERLRWRGLGIRIYHPNNMSTLGSISASPFQSTGPMPMGIAHGRHPNQSVPSPRSMGPPHGYPPQQRHSNGGSHVASGLGMGTPIGRAPPPSAILPSQPNAQPMQAQPNGLPVQSPMVSPNIASRPSSATTMPTAVHGPTYSAPVHRSPSSVPVNKG